MERNKIVLFIVIAMIILATVACKTNIENDMVVKSDDTSHTDIDALVYTQGNEDSEIVLIYSQGGPVLEIDTIMMEELAEIDERLNDVLMVDVHQVQTENPSEFLNDEITFEQAKEYNQKTLDNLVKVVNHYKTEGKQVYVIGISFGAFVTQELIAQNGSDIADGYIIMVGRLDIEEDFWKAFSEGNGGYYENGLVPYIEHTEDIIEKNMYKLAAGLGYNRYTEKLKDTDLSKVVYVYGSLDEQVGALTEKEVTFLETNGAKIIVGESEHMETVMNNVVESLDIVVFGKK